MTSEKLVAKETTDHVIGAFYEVYRTLGYGFLESVYKDALDMELAARSRRVEREVVVPVYYKGVIISRQRVDRLVDGCVVVEVKSTESLAASASRQLLNYLRATTFEVGLLLHFGPTPRFFRKVHSQRAPSNQ